ncbi:MAG: hypothetical protein KDC39_02170 [Actinobacteria bacterium]|nr:hypothetical protein [Actinomycetota bacterium]
MNESQEWSAPQGPRYDRPPSAPLPHPPTLDFAPPNSARVLLVDEPVAQPSKRPWIIITVIGAVVVLLLCGLVANWALQNASLSSLLSKVQVSEDAMGDVQDEVVRLIEESRAELGPLASNEQLVAQLKRDGNGTRIERASSQGADRVETAGRVIAEQTFPFWLGDVLNVQSVYLDHNRAWVDYLERASGDYTVWLSKDAMIEPTWVAAKAAIRGAVPLLAWPGVTDQVNNIVEDDEPGGGGSVIA